MWNVLSSEFARIYNSLGSYCACCAPQAGAADLIDVRLCQRRDTAGPPFGSWNAWIGLVIGASRCMAVISLGVPCLILGRSLQTLAWFSTLRRNCLRKVYMKIADICNHMSGLKRRVRELNARSCARSLKLFQNEAWRRY